MAMVIIRRVKVTLRFLTAVQIIFSLKVSNDCMLSFSFVRRVTILVCALETILSNFLKLPLNLLMISFDNIYTDKLDLELVKPFFDINI